MQHKIGDNVTFIFGLGDQSSIPLSQVRSIWNGSSNKAVGVVVGARVNANKQEVYEIRHNSGVIRDVYLPFTRK